MNSRNLPSLAHIRLCLNEFEESRTDRGCKYREDSIQIHITPHKYSVHSITTPDTYRLGGDVILCVL